MALILFEIFIDPNYGQIYGLVYGPKNGSIYSVFRIIANFLIAGFIVTNFSCPPPGRGPFLAGFGVSLFGFGGNFVVFGSV